MFGEELDDSTCDEDPGSLLPVGMMETEGDFDVVFYDMCVAMEMCGLKLMLQRFWRSLLADIGHFSNEIKKRRVEVQ